MSTYSEELSLAVGELPRLREYLWLIWLRRGSILAIAAVFLGAGLVYYSRQPEVYRSSSELLLRPISRRLGPLDIHEFSRLEPERRLAVASEMRRLAANRLGALAGQAEVAVEAPENSNSLVFNVTSQSPIAAQATAQAYSEVYLAFRKAQLQKDFLAAAELLDRQIEKIGRRIDQAAKSGVPGPEQQAQILALSGERARLEQQRDQVFLPDGIEVGRVLDTAVLPRAPVSPKLANTMAAALFFGLAAGTAQALARGWLVPRLQGRADLAQTVGGSVQAVIPEAGRRNGPLVTLTAPGSKTAEAYASLRSTVLFLRQREGVRSLLVTSPGPGEGKSKTVANLGLSLAQSGQQVVLVSADSSSRAGLHGYFPVPSGDGGLLGVLAGERTPGQALCPTFVDGLRVLHRGGSERGSSAVLAPEAIRRLLDDLEAEADLVIVDAAPVLGPGDTASLAVLVDAVLVVAAADRTTVGSLHETRLSLEQVGAPVIGAVLDGINGARVRFDRYCERRDARYIITRPSSGPPRRPVHPA